MEVSRQFLMSVYLSAVGIKAQQYIYSLRINDFGHFSAIYRERLVHSIHLGN